MIFIHEFSLSALTSTLSPLLSYLMTRFARASTSGGIVRPICFAAFKVDDELKLRCLLHRQISRFGTFQDLVHVNSRAPIEVIVVRPVGHETALIDKLLLEVNSRQPVFAGKLDDPLSFGEKAASWRSS